MDRRGWMNARKNMDRWIDGWMDGWIDGQTNGWMDRSIDGCIDRHGQMDGGWMDEGSNVTYTCM